MAVVAQIPLEPSIAPNATPIPANNTPATFRSNLNAYVASVEDKAQKTQAFLEGLASMIGNCAVSGGTISAGTGLSVNIALFRALCGNEVETDAITVVGGLTANATSSIYLRQDGTFTALTSGLPATNDGHGDYLLWGTATTGASTVTSVTNVRRAIIQNLSIVHIVNADPTNLIDGDVWYRSDTNQISVRVGGVTKRVTFA